MHRHGVLKTSVAFQVSDGNWFLEHFENNQNVKGNFYPTLCWKWNKLHHQVPRTCKMSKLSNKQVKLTFWFYSCFVIWFLSVCVPLCVYMHMHAVFWLNTKKERKQQNNKNVQGIFISWINIHLSISMNT